MAFNADSSTLSYLVKGGANSRGALPPGALLSNRPQIRMTVTAATRDGSALDVHGTVMIRVKDGGTILCETTASGPIGEGFTNHTYTLVTLLSGTDDPAVDDTSTPGNSYKTLTLPTDEAKTYNFEIEFNGFASENNVIQCELRGFPSSSTGLSADIQDKAGGRISFIWDIPVVI